MDPWRLMYLKWVILHIMGTMISEILLTMYVLLYPLPSKDKTKRFKQHTKELRIGMRKGLSEEAFQLVLEAAIDKALASISACHPMMLMAKQAEEAARRKGDNNEQRD